jgi:catechol 2,3-dioxygenase-like lactoylglutathione lyase family enzyme
MVATVHSITFDCANPKLVADFWSEVTGFVEDPDDPNLPEHEQFLLVGGNGTPNLLFIVVPEGKTVKNRVHLDIQPADRTRDEEVERLLKLGATIHEDHRQPDGRGWVTMADPEGNEFCVERSAAERAG